MHTSRLCRVDDSLMFAIPAELLGILQLRAGDTVVVSIENGQLIVEPRSRLRYTLGELLAVSDYSNSEPAHEREWIDAEATGREML